MLVGAGDPQEEPTFGIQTPAWRTRTRSFGVEEKRSLKSWCVGFPRP